MTEKLLQFIWQHQYFNQSHLESTAGDQLEVLQPGLSNTNQGPDFTGARVRMGGTVLAGSVELHIRTSEWARHGHSDDSNYKNVILHVVFEHDEAPDPSIPVLELQSRIPVVLLDQFTALMNSPSFIACAGSIAGIPDLTWTSWKERLLAERLLRKSELIFSYLRETRDHWEACFWRALFRNFGAKVNTEAFEAIGRSIPMNILSRHKNQIHQLEALLLGQAGLLDQSFHEDYPAMLGREYRFLQKKYGLRPIRIPIHFLRMRPQNFPTIRLSQLAALVHQSSHLFSGILETEQLDEVRKLFDVTANDYWFYHYMPDHPSSFNKKNLGRGMTDNLVINTLAPVVFAYGLRHHDQKKQDKAIRWLEETGPEHNSVTGGFSRLGLSMRSAFDSQALIELKTRYCDAKQCLKCAVGNAILKGSI